ncbi:class I adenylate-forming enzyme family protein [Methylobacterium sp. Gmos1]
MMRSEPHAPEERRTAPVAQGIPLAGAFGPDDAGPPRGTWGAQGWRVDAAVNATRAETVFGDRAVRTFRDRPATYDAMVRLAAVRNPDGEAVICGTRRLRYRELDDLVERTAAGLVGAGLAVGDRVAVMLDNRLEYVVAMLATIRAGGIAVPLGTRLGPEDVIHIVDHAAPTFAVTAAEWRPRLPDRAFLRGVFLVDAAEGSRERFDGLGRGGPAPLPVLQPEATMMIVYTSGTTGKPKGACLTHLNFVHTCLHYLYALALDRPQRSLLVIPATHIAGFGPVMSVTLACAGTLVLMREFKARAVLETMVRERVTFTVLVPAMYQLCLMEPSLGDHDLSRWRYGVYGGAIMPPAVIERVAERLPALRLVNAYGATETCAVCTIMPPELTAEASASVGLALECDDVRIVGEDGREAPAGQPGEVWIRGPNVTPGYWRDPDATAGAFQDGFWRSGDIGTRDARGLVFVHDRLKDMINRGGFKVFSAEVENALMQHPGVADCAVVGVPDPVLGERTFAYVTRRDPGLDPAGLRAGLLARIADYKVPDFWHVTDAAVPRNQNGKPQKAEVRRLAAGMVGGQKP